MPRTLNDEEMIRVSVAVTSETREELYQLARIIGIKPTHFFESGLVLGCRSLARAAAPEHFTTVPQLQNAMAAAGLDPEFFKRLVESAVGREVGSEEFQRAADAAAAEVVAETRGEASEE